MIQLPAHKTLTLEHNPHKNVYESVQEWLFSLKMGDKEITPEDLKIAIETDELWTLQWYPDTPVGFYFVAAPTLERLLERANEN